MKRIDRDISEREIRDGMSKYSLGVVKTRIRSNVPQWIYRYLDASVIGNFTDDQAVKLLVNKLNERRR